MDTKAIAAAIGAVVLTATAGASTWIVVFDHQTPEPLPAPEPIVTTVYIDQFGNQLDPASLVAPPAGQVAAPEPMVTPVPESTPREPAIQAAPHEEPRVTAYEDDETDEHDDDHEEEDDHA